MSTVLAEIRREIDEVNPGLPATDRATIHLRPMPWLGVRPCPKVAGRYQAWDVIDTKGRVVRACTDLFDAMMWIREHFAAKAGLAEDLQEIDTEAT